MKKHECLSIYRKKIPSTETVSERTQMKNKQRQALKILWAEKTSLAIQIKLNLAYFAQLTWPKSLLAYASGNHKQNLHHFPKLSLINTENLNIIISHHEEETVTVLSISCFSTIHQVSVHVFIWVLLVYKVFLVFAQSTY